MDNKITFLAGINTFYDSEKNFLGVFADVILSNLEQDTKYSINDIQQIVDTNTTINIPLDVIVTLLKRLGRQNFIEYKNLREYSLQNILLTTSGVKENIKNKEKMAGIDRDTNKLTQNIFKFIEKKYTISNIEKELENFIGNNFSELITILDGENENTTRINKLQEEIAKFFIYAEKRDPESFNLLKSILFGKIIVYTFVNFGTFDTNANIKDLSIYLDTNIIFSVLGFHADFYNKSSLELLKILKLAGIKIRVFEFTLDEVIYKLENYDKEYDNYSRDIPVDSIYYVLKKGGYTKAHVISLIENLEDKLLEKNIEIDYSLNVQKLLNNDNDDIFFKLEQRKSNKPKPVVKHDALVILAIKKLRGNKISRLIEKSKYIFITADNILSAFDKKIQNKFIIPEILLVSEIMSIFWIKKIQNTDNAFIHQFLTKYARQDLVKRKVWEKFLDNIRTLKINNNIDVNIDEIMSHNETKNILIEKGAKGIKDIINDKNISKFKKEKTEKELRIKKLEKKNKKAHEQFKQINDNIKNTCKSFWIKIINILIVIIGVLILYSLCILIKILGIEYTVAYIAAGSLFLFVIILAISLVFEKEFKLTRFLTHFLIDNKKQLYNFFVNRCIRDKKSKLFKNKDSDLTN